MKPLKIKKYVKKDRLKMSLAQKNQKVKTNLKAGDCTWWERLWSWNCYTKD
jgi:hypothetical protein